LKSLRSDISVNAFSCLSRENVRGLDRSHGRFSKGDAARWLAVAMGRIEKIRNIRVRGKTTLFMIEPLIRANSCEGG